MRTIKKSSVKFLALTRLGNAKYKYGGKVHFVPYKINDEAIRYDEIKKIYTDGALNIIHIDTYGGISYEIELESRVECSKTFYDILRFGDNEKTFLDYRKSCYYTFLELPVTYEEVKFDAEMIKDAERQWEEFENRDGIKYC